MPCTDFEDLLAAYSELTPAERQRADAHLSGCTECQSWFDAITEMDSVLTSEFEGVRAPATLEASIQRKVARSLPARVSAVPEILDFVGWLGVIGAVGLLSYFTIPSWFTLSPVVLFSMAAFLLCLALSVTVWVLRSSDG